MATLTKKQAASLATIAGNLSRVVDYLEKREVCVAGDRATTTLHYTRADGKTLYALDKWIGSELALLPTAIRDIRRMCEPNL